MNLTPTLGHKNKHEMHPVLLTFLLGMACALALFLPFVIVDKGFFLYAGDYNCQQIPFYKYVQGFIQQGGGTWSWSTDIGSSVVNSYAFYNIGSPFLWISTLFPNRWMPFLMVPLFVLKFGCIAAACSVYLKRYARTRNMLVIVSILYAFSGFNVYNIFFNHMLDPVVIFPLMLWALDGFIYEKRRGFFALSIGLALINSYFFFVGNVVFLLLYFFVKLATDEFRITPKEFGLLGFEAALGIGLGMVLALPAYFNVAANPRIDNFANGMSLVMYGSVHQYFNIITSMFLPPDPPYMPNLFTEGSIKWTSMSAFLPLISMAGVIAYCKSRKRTAIKYLLGFSLIMALVPVLNSSFIAFNASYYARWYYMPLLIMSFATLRSLEDADIDLERGTKITLGITAGYAIFGLLPRKIEDNTWTIGVAQYASKFWLTWFTAMLGIFVFYILVRFYRGKVRFAPLLLGAVMGFSVFYSVIHISLGKFPQWEKDAAYRSQQYDTPPLLNLPDDEFYRIDAYECYDNVGLWTGKSSLQTFNSTVTPSLYEFFPLMGVTRDVRTNPGLDLYALRGLLSAKYTIMPVNQQNNFIESPYTGGWTFFEAVNDLAVYENQNYVPMGFTYDSYILMPDLKKAVEGDRAALLMRSIGLTEEQAAAYGHLFENHTGNVPFPPNDPNQPSPNFSYEPVNFERYVQDCADRAATASHYFRADKQGFESHITLPAPNLVFFGVPYDAGFTATVNGEQAKVLKVSGGMMAVEAPAGENVIVFTYRTPGFSTGIKISLLCVVVLAAYMGGTYLLRRKKAGVPQSTAQQPAASAPLEEPPHSPEAPQQNQEPEE